MCFSIATCTTAEHPKPCLRIFWRIRTATQFSFTDISALGVELQHISIADERWALARQGHAAEAISMMVALWPVSSVSRRIDAVMTAVILAALTGSDAAALVAYHTTAQLAANLPKFRTIAASWLAVVKERERCRFFRTIEPRTSQRRKGVASTQFSPGLHLMNYAEYMSSAAWRFNPVRLRELKAAGFQCRLCPNTAVQGHALEAHHRTYERLGHEIDGDLTALCRECHRGVTSMLRARRYASSPPETSDCAPAIADPPPLFDPFATGASE